MYSNHIYKHSIVISIDIYIYTSGDPCLSRHGSTADRSRWLRSLAVIAGSVATMKPFESYFE